MSRIQFQKGFSMNEFLANYGRLDQCESYLEKARWPDGFVCPSCRHSEYGIVWHRSRKHFQCRNCRHQTSILAGTIFENTKLPLTKWFQGAYLLSQSKNNVSALELKRLLGVCYRTAWRLKHKFIQVMTERERHRRLTGRIEISVVSREVNQSTQQTRRNQKSPIRFIAAIETDSQHHPKYALFSAIRPVIHLTRRNWFHHSFHPDSTLHTGAEKFERSMTIDQFHGSLSTTFNTGESPKRRKPKWIRIVVGNLLSAMDGTYHRIKEGKYLHRYLAEVQYRFNRRFDLSNLFSRIILAAVQNPARTEIWLRAVDETGHQSV